MALNIGNFKQMYKPWFSTVPVNAVKAKATLTLNGNSSDGELVTIGNEVYEFDTNASVTAGHIRVNIGGGNSASQSVTALVNAINTNSAICSAADGALDTVVITYLVVGTEGNDIAVSETMNNGTFTGATKLSGGVYGTPCACPNAFIEIAGVIYYTSTPMDKYGATWYSITPVLIT